MARWWERVSRALQMEEVGAGWPAEIIPYRAGMIGGLAGGSAMVLVAIAYGLLSGREETACPPDPKRSLPTSSNPASSPKTCDASSWNS